jgi:hypothetical protein
VPAYSKRPSPCFVQGTVERLASTTETVTLPAIVTMLRQSTGCSRATAYRAVSDALQEGAVIRDTRSEYIDKS